MPTAPVALRRQGAREWRRQGDRRDQARRDRPQDRRAAGLAQNAAAPGPSLPRRHAAGLPDHRRALRPGRDAMSTSRICGVTAGGPYPWIIVNALGKVFGPIDALAEQPEPHSLFLKRRARKIGWFSTAGQFATMVLVRLGKKRFAARID